MILERLDDVTRPFDDILLIGAQDRVLAADLAQRGALAIVEPSHPLACRFGALAGEEDALPVEPDSTNLIIWPGGLDSVNDVPGALLRCRFALKPDGLLLGCFVGDGSFPALRHCFTDATATRVVQRMHPQIEVRAIGDLLARAGLALPVVDVERLTIRYGALDRLVADLRAATLTNMLADTPPLTRDQRAAAFARFDSLRDADGRVSERINIIHFSGWAPDASQPRPAARGSARASLADALRRGGSGG